MPVSPTGLTHRNPITTVVRAEWLYACASQRSILDWGEYIVLPNQSLSMSNFKRTQFARNPHPRPLDTWISGRNIVVPTLSILSASSQSVASTRQHSGSSSGHSQHQTELNHGVDETNSFNKNPALTGRAYSLDEVEDIPTALPLVLEPVCDRSNLHLNEHEEGSLGPTATRDGEQPSQFRT